jgi:hypothetical protein
MPRTFEKTFPHAWVEQSLIHDAAAKVWIEALHKHNRIDSPNSKRKKPHPAPSSSTRKEIIDETQGDFAAGITGNDDDASSQYSPSGDEVTPTKSAKKRKSNRKSVASVGLEPGLVAMVVHHVREAIYV